MVLYECVMHLSIVKAPQLVYSFCDLYQEKRGRWVGGGNDIHFFEFVNEYNAPKINWNVCQPSAYNNSF
jgi:hypothetical protein